MALHKVLNMAIRTINSDNLTVFESSDAVIYFRADKFVFMVNEDEKSYYFAISPGFAEYLNIERKFRIIETDVLHSPLLNLNLVQDETHFLFIYREENVDYVVFAFEKVMVDDDHIADWFLFHNKNA